MNIFEFATRGAGGMCQNARVCAGWSRFIFVSGFCWGESGAVWWSETSWYLPYRQNWLTCVWFLLNLKSEGVALHLCLNRANLSYIHCMYFLCTIQFTTLYIFTLTGGWWTRFSLENAIKNQAGQTLYAGGKLRNCSWARRVGELSHHLKASNGDSLPPSVTQHHVLDLSRVQHRRRESAEPKKETHVSFSDTSPRWDRKESHSRRSPKSRLSLSTSRGVPCLSTRSWCFVTKWESSPAGLRGGTNASRRWRYCRSSSASVVPKRASCSSVWSIPWLTAPSCMFWKEKPITQVSTEGSPSRPQHEQNESRWYRAVAVKNRCTFLVHVGLFLSLSVAFISTLCKACDVISDCSGVGLTQNIGFAFGHFLSYWN